MELSSNGDYWLQSTQGTTIHFQHRGTCKLSFRNGTIEIQNEKGSVTTAHLIDSHGAGKIRFKTEEGNGWEPLEAEFTREGNIVWPSKGQVWLRGK